MERVENREWLVLENQGFRIFGVMHCPRDVSNYPAVLICHGFGGNKCGKHRVYVGMAEALARRGIATLRVDFRGCGDSEGSFSEGSLSGYVRDLHAVVNWTKEQKWSSSIGLSGRSFGGVVASITASEREDIHALSLVSAPYSFDSYSEEGVPPTLVFDKEKRVVLCHGEKMSAQFVDDLYSTQMSGVMEKLNAIPFMYIGGREDTVVPLPHLDKYKEIRKGPSLFHVLALGDHRLSRKEDREFVVRECAEWFSHHLLM